MKSLTTEREIFDFLIENIPSTKELAFPAEFGLARTKYFLEKLGNPQDQYPSIHIAGTSGKGSTSFYSSHILNSLGLKVGLIQSPHVLNIKERFQINNSLISPEKYIQYFNEILDVMLQMKDCEYGIPTYFEIVTVLAFYIFKQEKVDVAVIETGLGGLYDASNTISRKDKICVITAMGLDHMRILGNTIAEIATQKAGIIHEDNTVVMIEQSEGEKEAENIVEATARVKHAEFHFIKRGKHFEEAQNLHFNFHFESINIEDIKLATIASYQIPNCALALAASYLCTSRQLQLTFDTEKIKNRLKTVHFIGRMDVHMVHNLTIVLDGAHNQQKMQAFIESLTKNYPNRKFHFMMAFKKDKDYQHMIDACEPYIVSLTTTRLWIAADNSRRYSIDPDEIATYARSAYSSLKKDLITSYDTPKDALDYILSITNETDIIVVTGSLFLVGKVLALLPQYTAQTT